MTAKTAKPASVVKVDDLLLKLQELLNNKKVEDLTVSEVQELANSFTTVGKGIESELDAIEGRAALLNGMSDCIMDITESLNSMTGLIKRYHTPKKATKSVAKARRRY